MTLFLIIVYLFYVFCQNEISNNMLKQRVDEVYKDNIHLKAYVLSKSLLVSF